MVPVEQWEYCTLLEPETTISPFYHLGPQGVPSGYFAQFPNLTVSSCPASFLYKQLFVEG